MLSDTGRGECVSEGRRVKGECGARVVGRWAQRTRASLRNRYTCRAQIKWRRGRNTEKS